MGKALETKELVKWYGKEVLALNKVTFDIDAGDFFVIVGPSGCGKSTLLKVIAGILDYDSGKLYINGVDMKGVPPYKRDVSMMLENYALFPHMNVFDNVAFGLRMLGKDKSEIEREVKEALKLVGLAGLEKRMPLELSGGQRQRVALARALVINPSILLLDEPLSHVDYRLQRKLMEDLKEIHRKVGNTFILTTHVQEHALSLADTVMVMNTGVIEQIGKPEEVYNNPATVFAARFVGEINLFSAQIKSWDGGLCYLNTDIGELKANPKNKSALSSGDKVAYAVRPERVKIGEEAKLCDNKVDAKLVSYYYFGHYMEYVFQAGNSTKIKVSVPTEKVGNLTLGSTYLLGWDAKDALLIEKPCMIEGLDIEEVIYGK
ncbi:MAG: ABC transporter ATP-binding protein [Thaumarchaeota archaeon]|jgi:ABC-type Fe3+/spermidine/putrescine transport system ATPase subunit|nr:ABC transporter ATP-binding protein [Candidatus Terraquivivens yellowstonensis]MCL7393036.1 ABC transporter ATP-binding protein [Candidatus Terraquivivens yellowstonensis]MCL7398354.1 ABC transporter ATP-binding protein [Candidatus Terraquivivens yellowstonensis]MCL7399803.1 ABC transporter ATP-binding protein [Candidatus Terraquivivens yellowstonensis]MCL7401046.1 ABC transporter ATP-binding protein [Candidatus Terraquivivens yellowstonensis]